MGKIVGVLSLLLGIVSIVLIPLALVVAIPFAFIIMWATSIGAIVLGIIGIIVDDSKTLGVVGLILGILSIVLRLIILPLILIGSLLAALT